MKTEVLVYIMETSRVRTHYRKYASRRRLKKKGPVRNINPVIDQSTDVSAGVVDAPVLVHEPEHCVDTLEPDLSIPTASGRKLSKATKQLQESIDVTKEKLSGYRFIDIEIITNLLNVVVCPTCYSKLSLSQKQKQGLAFEMDVTCCSAECDFHYTFWTSKKKRRKYDINSRIYYAMRRIQLGMDILV